MSPIATTRNIHPATWGSLRVPILMVLAVAAVTAACDGSTLSPITEVPEALVAEIRIQPDEGTIFSGETILLSTELIGSDGTPLTPGSGAPTVAWSTMAPEVVSVSGSGLVTGTGHGFTEVHATAGGRRATALVIVQPETPDLQFEENGEEYEGIVGIGPPDSVAVRVLDQDGSGLSDVTVRFVPEPGSGTASPALAVTDTDGFVRTEWTMGTQAGPQELVAIVPIPGEVGASAASGGDASEGTTAASTNPAGRLRGWAKAAEPAEVSVSPEAATTEIEETLQFQAEVRDRHGNVLDDVSVTWSSQGPEVASVDGTGLSTGLADGTTTIEAEADGVTGSAELTVQSVGDDPPPSDPSAPGTVTDLRTTSSTTSSVSLAFTEVDDGTGSPAHYRVRYAMSATNPLWPDEYTTVTEGECANPVEGAQVDATFTCEVPGLESGTSYDFRLIAYRYDEDGSRVFGGPSNIATDETAGSAPPPSTGTGIWIDPSALSSLPTSGPAWDNVKSMADGSCPSFQLSDQDNRNNTCVMAKALVYARTGEATYLTGVLEALTALASMGTYDGRALAMGRNLGAYAIAADLVDLPTLDPSLDAALRTKLRELLTTYTTGAASSLVDCHENRPNNWGAHCGGSRAAVAVYLGDTEELARTAQVFRGFLGERSSYTGFTFGGPYGSRDHSWECDESAPVGINPRDCMKEGRNLGGVIPDDQRRGGSFDPGSWPPPKELYVWEALQGTMMQAVILQQAGYDPFAWGDQAILRAVTFLHEVVDFPADRGNTWQPHLVNRYYGTSFPAPVPSRYGKNVGWTDWTHGGG